MKRTQIRKRTRRLLAVAGASMVMAVPGTAALASIPDETTHTETTNTEPDGCRLAEPGMLRSCAHCPTSKGTGMASSGFDNEHLSANVSNQVPSGSEEVSVVSTSGSDVWPDAEYLWIAASIGAVAGAVVAFLHRRQPPLVS